MSAPERPEPSDPARSATPGPLPDGWESIYGWLVALTPTTTAAEALTAEVCRRLASGPPPWLAGRPASKQHQFFAVQVVLEARGVLAGRPR
ncbi:hypothetical protein [Blastococcus sp. CT_GayMR16]|uniref:hypothetical protein n=1 Tax=Blastococcus sp. CT_GayMR16 TaxID=2559607 RepID=UPI0010744DFF|nr:hypothetical protein [Blastococcus sp. CT_GayMR16]TFV89566.1 hypothetical protein E4P38_07325 [Blastococcus sp. CT_GayMR16]